MLTRDHDGRGAYRYESLEFFRPNDPAVYNPTYTLDEMVRRGEIEYKSGLLVESYAETDDGVAVRARDRLTRQTHIFSCRRLVLAAGTLNTAKIVLKSNTDYTSSLPLLDPALSYIPLVDPWMIGGALDRSVYSAAMLIAIYQGERAPGPIQMALYGVAGTLRSDYLFDFPLSVCGNIAAAKYLTPALVLVQVSYPETTPSTRIRLLPDDRLEIRSTGTARLQLEPHLVRLFRRLGYYCSTALCRQLAPGNSYRYAGTLPMTAAPSGRYQTNRHGLLSGTRAVYIADAATLSPLPSKNHSFTMMANAMRIAAHVGRTLS